MAFVTKPIANIAAAKTRYFIFPSFLMNEKGEGAELSFPLFVYFFLPNLALKNAPNPKSPEPKSRRLDGSGGGKSLSIETAQL